MERQRDLSERDKDSRGTTAALQQSARELPELTEQEAIALSSSETGPIPFVVNMDGSLSKSSFTNYVLALQRDAYIRTRIRFNAFDGRKGGMTLDESYRIAKILSENGADSVQITARTISFKFGEDGDHAFLSYADKLAKELDVPVILGGTLRDMKTMNEILNETDIEFLSLAKPFVAQQDFLLEWKENGDGVSRCKGCNNCYGKKESRCFQFG